MNELYFFFEKNPTVVVSIGAAFFTFLTTILITALNFYFSKKNLDRQLKVQLQTTIRKEWLNAVQLHLSSLLKNTNYIVLMLMDEQFKTKNIKEMYAELGKMILEVFDAESQLGLLLDTNDKLEKDCADRVKELTRIITRDLKNANKGDVNIKVLEINTAFHNLYNRNTLVSR